MPQQKSRQDPSPVNITRHLSGIDFPVSKQDLINHVKQNGAEDDVIEMLQDMDDIEYASLKNVMREYGKKYKKSGVSVQRAPGDRGPFYWGTES